MRSAFRRASAIRAPSGNCAPGADERPLELGQRAGQHGVAPPLRSGRARRGSARRRRCAWSPPAPRRCGCRDRPPASSPDPPRRSSARLLPVSRIGIPATLRGHHPMRVPRDDQPDAGAVGARRPAARSRRCRPPHRRLPPACASRIVSAGRRAATSPQHVVQRQLALAEAEPAGPCRGQQALGLGRNVADHRDRSSRPTSSIRYGVIQSGRRPVALSSTLAASHG